MSDISDVNLSSTESTVKSVHNEPSSVSERPCQSSSANDQLQSDKQKQSVKARPTDVKWTPPADHKVTDPTDVLTETVTPAPESDTKYGAYGFSGAGVKTFNFRGAGLYDGLNHGETSDEVSEMCTEESIEKMTNSVEGILSLSESSGKDTFAQAQLYSWPEKSEANELEDSDDQMNELIGSYREISMDEGTQDDNDTDNEVSNLSPDSAAEEDGKRPNTLFLPKSWNATPDAGSSDKANAMYVGSEDSKSDDMNLEEILSCLQGLVLRDGDMVSFVAENLQEKIKMASPVLKKEDGSSSSRSGSPSLYRQSFTPLLPPVDSAAIQQLELHCQKVASMLDTTAENLTGTLHSISSLAVDCLDTYKDGVCRTCDSMDANIKSMYQLMAKCEEMSYSMRPIFKLQNQIKEISRLVDIMENLSSGNNG